MKIKYIVAFDEIALSIAFRKTIYNQQYKYCFDLHILFFNVYILFKKR
jgi:hypothetical protein